MSLPTSETPPSSAPIAVVVPAYRVKAHIHEVIEGALPHANWVIVVDDACDEGSGSVAEEFREEKKVVLIRHEKNQGVGGAVMTGYIKALELGAKIVVKMDGDGQMDPDRLPALVAPLRALRADYTKGNRFYELAALRAMPFVRRMGNTVLSFIVKAVSGYWSMADPTNGYTAIRAEALERLDFSRIHKRYFFECDMLVNLNIIGAVVLDVPMPARYGGERSSLTLRRVFWEFPPLLARRLFARIYWRYLMLDLAPQGLFLLAGMLGLFFGVGFGGWRWYSSIATGQVQSTGTVMLAALPLLMGFMLVLQAVALDMQAAPREPLCRSSLSITDSTSH